MRIGGRLVPIDAKFPLENFRRLLDETDEDKRPRPAPRLRPRRARTGSTRSRKRYILPDEGTFDFALMYIPAENVYYEIIVKDDGAEGDSPATYAMAPARHPRLAQ